MSLLCGKSILRGNNARVCVGTVLWKQFLQHPHVTTTTTTTTTTKATTFSSTQVRTLNQNRLSRCFTSRLDICRHIHNNSNTLDQPTATATPYDDNNNDKTFTHFGYESVEEGDKVVKVYEVFEKVAATYDLMNDVMSAGTHRLWKQHFVSNINIRPQMSVLDMAGGTGDIAFKIFDDFARKYPTGTVSKDTYPDIVIGDINANMLKVGQERANKLGIKQLFEWVQTDAEELPFEDETFDVYTIAFGIRNCTHIERVLDEAFRVLKIGGRLSVLEFSHVDNPLVGEMYDNYSMQVIPVLGQVFANDWNSYQYLVESIRRFPDQETFAEMIYDSGFSNVRYENLTFGVVAIHDAFKI